MIAPGIILSTCASVAFFISDEISLVEMHAVEFCAVMAPRLVISAPIHCSYQHSVRLVLTEETEAS